MKDKEDIFLSDLLHSTSSGPHINYNASGGNINNYANSPASVQSGTYIHTTDNEKSKSEQVQDLLDEVDSIKTAMVMLSKRVMELTSSISEEKHERRKLKM